MAVPTAITKITNIESKARRTLRKLILSQQAVPVECRRPRILRQRPPLGICLLLQCGRGPFVYVCAALDWCIGTDCPEWIFCCRGIFPCGGQNIPSAATRCQGQSARARGGNSGGRSAPRGF